MALLQYSVCMMPGISYQVPGMRFILFYPGVNKSIISNDATEKAKVLLIVCIIKSNA